MTCQRSLIMEKLLEGITVVELSTAAAGPMAGKLLAEYGADVIFVEAPSGIMNRYTIQFGFMFTGKRTIALDLKTDEGKEVLYRILKRADVFISNFRKKALKKLGFWYDDIKERYPSLIYAFISGYGEKGAMKDDPGYDNTAFWGHAGLLHDMTERSTMDMSIPPQLSGVGDFICGTTLAMGIGMALNYRDRTGKGVKVSASLLSLGLYVNASQMIQLQYGASYPKSRLEPDRALSNTYPAKDGWFYLITLNFEKDFPKLLEIIGRQDLIGDPRWQCMEDTEGAGAKELRSIFDQGFRQFPIKELREMFREKDLAFGELLGCRDEIDDPQAIENGYLTTIRNADGRVITVPVSPVRYNDDAHHILSPAPELGRDTGKILEEYGYTPAMIKKLIQEKTAVAGKREEDSE